MAYEVPEEIDPHMSNEELLDLYAQASLCRVTADTNTQEQQWEMIFYYCREILLDRILISQCG